MHDEHKNQINLLAISYTYGHLIIDIHYSSHLLNTALNFHTYALYKKKVCICVFLYSHSPTLHSPSLSSPSHSLDPPSLLTLSPLSFTLITFSLSWPSLTSHSLSTLLLHLSHQHTNIARRKHPARSIAGRRHLLGEASRLPARLWWRQVPPATKLWISGDTKVS